MFVILDSPLSQAEKQAVKKYLKHLEFNPIPLREPVFHELYDGDKMSYDVDIISDSVMAEIYIMDYLDHPGRAEGYYSFHGRGLRVAGWSPARYKSYVKILRKHINKDENIAPEVKTGLRKLTKYTHGVVLKALTAKPQKSPPYFIK